MQGDRDGKERYRRLGGHGTGQEQVRMTKQGVEEDGNEGGKLGKRRKKKHRKQMNLRVCVWVCVGVGVGVCVYLVVAVNSPSNVPTAARD